MNNIFNGNAMTVARTVPFDDLRVFFPGLLRLSFGFLVSLLVALLVATPAWAQLKPGETAPFFKTPAALAGKAFEFDLKGALKNGPVVVYFYPRAFTSGCTIEAQTFAESIDAFKAQKATVVGVSGDDLETLKKFSEGPCGGKFAVASDESGRIMNSYDAALKVFPGMANRISYVISPDGKVVDVFESLSPVDHVKRTLGSVTAWQAAQPK
jgi:peroxiredoxin